MKRNLLSGLHHVLFNKSLSRVRDAGRVVVAIGSGGNGTSIAFGSSLLTLFVYEITLEASEFLLFFILEQNL